jgi:hypothetical protein
MKQVVTVGHRVTRFSNQESTKDVGPLEKKKG